MWPGWLQHGAPVGPPAPCIPHPRSCRSMEKHGNALPLFPEELACVSSSAGERLDNRGMSWVLWWWFCSQRSRCEPLAPRRLLGSARSWSTRSACSAGGEGDRKAPEGFFHFCGKSYRCPGHRELSVHLRDMQAPRCLFSGWIDGSQLQTPREKER